MHDVNRRKTRPRANGRAYQKGGVWWITYQHRGERIREAGGLDGRGARTKTEAEEKLRRRFAEIYSGRFTGAGADRLVVDDLLGDYIKHLETTGAKGVRQVRSHLNPVRKAFGADRACNITTIRLRDFVEARQAEACAPATINRSLQDLRAAFNLARKEGRFGHVPYFPLLPERNARTGFFERAEHEAIRARLGEPYADVAEFGYLTGWRRGEILGLRWVDVDRVAGVVSLMDSKNGDPRTFPLRAPDGTLTEVGDLIERRWAARWFTGPKQARLESAFVFHDRGHRAWGFDEAWRAAVTAANLLGRLFHDYRRTAVRDLVRAGVSQTVAMSQTGHRTDAVFRRYNITSVADKQDAVGKVAAYRKAQAAALATAAIERLAGVPIESLQGANA